MNTDYFNDQLENNGLVIRAEDGETLEANGMKLTFKVTSELSNDQLGLYEIRLAPGAIGARLHYHRFMDETFVVTQGQLTLELLHETHQLNPGEVAYAPRFTPHGFRNDSQEEVRLMLLFNPSQKREGFFLGLRETLSEVPIDPEKYLKLYNKYDSFPVDTSQMLPIRDTE